MQVSPATVTANFLKSAILISLKSGTALLQKPESVEVLFNNLSLNYN